MNFVKFGKYRFCKDFVEIFLECYVDIFFFLWFVIGSEQFVIREVGVYFVGCDVNCFIFNNKQYNFVF